MGVDLFLSPITFGAFLAYLVWEVTTQLTKKKAEEMGRRVLAISVGFVFATFSLSTLFAQISGLVSSPWLDGPVLSVIWLVSIYLYFSWALELYDLAVAHSNRGEEAEASVVDYALKQLETRLGPLTGAIATAQASVSELSGRVTELGEETGEMVSIVESQGKAVRAQTQVVEKISKDEELRESEYKRTVAEYYDWFEKRGESARTIAGLIKGTEGILEKFAILSEQVDEYLGSLARGRESPKEQREDAGNGGDGAQGQKAAQEVPKSPAEVEAPAPQTGGKLTREAGIANRDKGNRAQLQFSENTLRNAGKMHTSSLKEGEPDFIFYGSPDNVVKAVGAFKALTLSEAGTRQRWIPRGKLLAELKTAIKYGVPLILFILNLANGRIWAKVIAVEEGKKFEGMTTPLMLIGGDPASDKTCKETLDMALKLL
ncbi:MAG: hypothetical protein LYZ69_07935 [Nitrososphaerales archaeon]|nr:hypothetical protein [Nitrososphaerales archaeon]